jgi:hypothetical protein
MSVSSGLVVVPCCCCCCCCDMLTVLCLDHHKYPARRDQQIVRKCDSVWINDNVRFLSRRTFLEKDGMSGVNKGDLNRRRRIPVLIPFVPKEMHSSRPSLLHTYIHTYIQEIVAFPSIDSSVTENRHRIGSATFHVGGLLRCLCANWGIVTYLYLSTAGSHLPGY